MQPGWLAGCLERAWLGPLTGWFGGSAPHDASSQVDQSALSLLERGDGASVLLDHIKQRGKRIAMRREPRVSFAELPLANRRVPTLGDPHEADQARRPKLTEDGQQLIGHGSPAEGFVKEVDSCVWSLVIPAQAGIQEPGVLPDPAFAGMTEGSLAPHEHDGVEPADHVRHAVSIQVDQHFSAALGLVKPLRVGGSTVPKRGGRWIGGRGDGKGLLDGSQRDQTLDRLEVDDRASLQRLDRVSRINAQGAKHPGFGNGDQTSEGRNLEALSGS